MNTKILVTGISGLLGNRVGDTLSKAGYDVIGTFYEHENLVWTREVRNQVRCDLSETSQVSALNQNFNISAIVHCAAMTNVDQCEKLPEQAYRANVLATRNLTRIAQERNAKFIYISTSSVFSGEKGNYPENGTPYPLNFYSWTKLLGEEITLAGCKALIVRATIIGIHPRRTQANNFLEWIVQKLLHDQDITLFNDIYINPFSDISLAALIPELLERNLPTPVLHVGTNIHCSKAEIGTIIIEKYFPQYRGKVIRTVSDANVANMTRRAKKMWLNVDKIECEGIATMPSVEEELDQIESLYHSNQLSISKEKGN